MKKILALIVVSLLAQNAYADTCSKNLMPAFTSAQATELCATFTGSSTISASLIPGTDNTYDLGDATHTMRTLYVGTSILPDAAGGANLGSVTLPFGIVRAGDATRVMTLGDDNTSGYVGTETNVGWNLVIAATPVWSINTSGVLANNATTGGEITFNRAGTGPRIVYGVPTMAATPVAGTNDFASKISMVPTAAADTAAFLPASPNNGDEYVIVNTGPNTIRVKPGAGDTINGAAANAYFPIPTLQRASCVAQSSGAWQCSVSLPPTPAGP